MRNWLLASAAALIASCGPSADEGRPRTTGDRGSVHHSVAESCGSGCCDPVCWDLDEASCTAEPGCTAVVGVPVMDPDQIDPFGENPSFIGCRTDACEIEYAPVCVFHPDAPEDCWALSVNMTPDGWSFLFDCTIPEGFCGK